MCNNIDVLFSIIRVERVWCGMLVSAAGFINNGDMFEYLPAGIQNTIMSIEDWGMVCEAIGKCTHGHTLFYIFTKDDQ